MTDANQGYTLDIALEASDVFAEYGVYWLEEPLFVEDIEGHATLREEGKSRIAVGENLHTYYAFGISSCAPPPTSCSRMLRALAGLRRS